MAGGFMFERYTERARKIVFFARYEATQFGSTTIEPEHFLLGLMREDRDLVARVFPRVTSLEEIRKEVEGRVIVRKPSHVSVGLPLSPEAKTVLAFAAEESERLHHRYLGTEHLLLGLLRQEKSVAAEILYEQGLRIDKVREDLQATRSQTSDVEAPATHLQTQQDKFTVLLQMLESKNAITLDDLKAETSRLASSLPFQALLNILVKNGVITAEEFKELSIDKIDKSDEN